MNIFPLTALALPTEHMDNVRPKAVIRAENQDTSA